MTLIHGAGAVLYSIDAVENVVCLFDPTHDAQKNVQTGSELLQESIQRINAVWNTTTRSQAGDLYTLENLRKRGNGEE